MRFPFELLPAHFISRPNRFLVVARLAVQDETVRVHCADPGRMRELLLPGTSLYLSRSSNERRKTQYDLRLVVHPENGELVSVDSQLPNRLFVDAMEAGALVAFRGYSIGSREVVSPVRESSPGGTRSRFDFLLEDGAGRELWLEVKSATLVEERIALFPDARTERGRRHVLELADLRERFGVRAGIVFIVQRSDADEMRPQWVIDPAFASALHRAEQRGVALHAYACAVTLQEIYVDRCIPVVVSPPDGEAVH